MFCEKLLQGIVTKIQNEFTLVYKPRTQGGRLDTCLSQWDPQIEEEIVYKQRREMKSL